jgi:predicted SAM-dependent methyltransferase
MSSVAAPQLSIPVFLHVGCGRKRKDRTPFASQNWREIRLDIDSSVQPDVIGTMIDMKAVVDASVDAVFSSHNIEHLYPHEVSIALAEFHRVLKPDGFVLLTCPDLQSVCARVANDQLTDAAYQSGMGPITPVDILYGHRASMKAGNLYMAHRCGFTKKVLASSLSSAGFDAGVIARPTYFDLWAVGLKSSGSESDRKDRMIRLCNQYFPEKLVD